MTYEETMDYINSTLRFGSVLGLSRIEKLLELLGNPEKKLKCIHIAGTNGKGSTTAMISEMLLKAGYKVGMYTSPYIEEFEERIQINRTNIPKDKLCGVMEKVKEAADKVKDEELEYPTEFEIITCAAFLYFSMEEVDYAVIEVGLGGRFDATNVINPILTVITSISYDHMQILGDTLEKIAYEKAGIIKQAVPLVLYPQREEADEVVREIAHNKNAEIIDVPETCANYIENIIIENKFCQKITVEGLRDNYDINLALLGKHQILNCAVAVYAIEKLCDMGVIISKEHILEGLSAVGWKGRLEIIKNKPLVVIDGAHNIDGIKKLSESVQTYFKYNRIILILGMLGDKQVYEMVKEIVPRARRVVTVAPKNDRAEAADKLLEVVKKFNESSECEEDYEKAYDRALSYYEKGDMILVCGSLYMIGDMRKVILNKVSRQLGIIKWFGGYNPKSKKYNDFGFITKENNEDLYFNKKHIHCNIRELTKETVVSFEEGINFKNNMPQGLKIKLIKDEKDINLLEQLVEGSYFNFVDILDRIDLLCKIDDYIVAKNWNNFALEVKILFLYKLCKEDLEFNYIEEINEKNKIVRAMLLLLWVKRNAVNKNKAFEKANCLLEEYKVELDSLDNKENILKLIIPTSEKGIVNLLKPIESWSILEFIQGCNGKAILDELDSGLNSELAKLVFTISSYTKI